MKEHSMTTQETRGGNMEPEVSVVDAEAVVPDPSDILAEILESPNREQNLAENVFAESLPRKWYQPIQRALGRLDGILDYDHRMQELSLLRESGFVSSELFTAFARAFAKSDMSFIQLSGREVENIWSRYPDRQQLPPELRAKVRQEQQHILDAFVTEAERIQERHAKAEIPEATLEHIRREVHILQRGIQNYLKANIGAEALRMAEWEDQGDGLTVEYVRKNIEILFGDELLEETLLQAVDLYRTLIEAYEATGGARGELIEQRPAGKPLFNPTNLFGLIRRAREWVESHADDPAQDQRIRALRKNLEAPEEYLLANAPFELKQEVRAYQEREKQNAEFSRATAAFSATERELYDYWIGNKTQADILLDLRKELGRRGQEMRELASAIRMASFEESKPLLLRALTLQDTQQALKREIGELEAVLQDSTPVKKEPLSLTPEQAIKYGPEAFSTHMGQLKEQLQTALERSDNPLEQEEIEKTLDKLAGLLDPDKLPDVFRDEKGLNQKGLYPYQLAKAYGDKIIDRETYTRYALVAELASLTAGIESRKSTADAAFYGDMLARHGDSYSPTDRAKTEENIALARSNAQALLERAQRLGTRG